LEHRLDKRHKIRFSAINRLKRKRTDGFQAALDSLKAEFFGEFLFVDGI